MKPVLRWTVFWFALMWFAHFTHCSWSTTCREIQLCDTLTLVPWIKQILRRYKQPSEFSEFPWHILRHIFLLYDHKIKKTAKSILLSAHGWSFAKTTMQGISSFNFCWFQQPIRSCGIVLTANQHCRQNLAAVSTNLWEFVSVPILAVAVREKVWESLKLGLISGYEIPNLQGSLIYTLLLGNHLNILV